MININYGDIELLKKISEGSFGSLYKAHFRPKNNEKTYEIALKQVVLSKKVKNEINILRILSNHRGFPDLIFVYNNFKSSSNNSHVIIGSYFSIEKCWKSLL